MSVLEEHLHRQPVLTTPYDEPTRHWKTENERTSNEIVDRRRFAFEPLPMGEELSWQSQLGLESDDPTEGGPIDRLRGEVRDWRKRGWRGTTHATRELLEFWSRRPGEGPRHSLFFAQREAVETIVYLTEAVDGRHWMVDRLKGMGQEWSGGLVRLAVRMATGTGKTVVMACLIAWYAVNRRREHRASAGGLARNVDRIVVICPGRTIQKQLSKLNPRGKGNIYDDWRLVPRRLRPRLSGIAVNILNWEKLQPQAGAAYSGVETKTGGGRLSRSKAISLAGGEEVRDAKRTLDQMWSDLLGPPNRKGQERVVVFNDEGHHCWQRREGRAPGVWMEALHALRGHQCHRLDQAIDLTATPIFIDPANTEIPEGVGRGRLGLVPWIVSEFALMESMEAGLVKIPQVPRRDGGLPYEESVLRNLFEANNGQALTTPGGMKLVRDGARVLYQDYKREFEAWSKEKDSRVGRPVLVVVANNKRNARAVFEMLGGKKGPDGATEASEFELLSNVPRNGVDESECTMHTILVLSRSNAPEKAEHEQIAGGALGLREVGDGASENELRAVLQTVAQPGKVGEEVRCVVSVGMLTEGWDCQRVTHILGYRRFGSQLLCEQTMGRALRRRDYDNLADVKIRDAEEIERRFRTEYAIVFGVPFTRVVEGGEAGPPVPPQPKTIVRPVEDRVETYRIWIPDFSGYTMSVLGPRLALDVDKVQGPALRSGQVDPPIERVEAQGPVGKRKVIKHRVEELSADGAWLLASDLVHVLSEGAERTGEGEATGRERRGILFGECLRIVREWLGHEAVLMSESELEDDRVREAAQSDILHAIIGGEERSVQKVGIPSDPNEMLRSAGQWRPFETGLQDIVELKRSELNVAACHSKLEARIARHLDASRLVKAFVRNHGPERLEIPYKYKGVWVKYVPDFFVRCGERDGRTVHVVLEGKGLPDERSERKGWWTDHWWIPCANDAGREHGQIWVRREIGTHLEVDSALKSAIEEGERQ